MSMKRTVGIAVLASMMLSAPSVALAAGEQGSFCTSFATRSAELERQVAAREERMEQAQAAQLKRIEGQRDAEDKAIEQRRDDADREWNAVFAALAARARTQAERNAVAAYRTTIGNAIATRRSAIDAAFATFRTGVDNAVAARQTAIRNAFATFETSVNRAIAAAQADCDNRVAPATVRRTFESRLAVARTQLAADREAAPDLAPAIDRLRAAKHASIVAARNAFYAAARIAKAELNKVLR